MKDIKVTVFSGNLPFAEFADGQSVRELYMDRSVREFADGQISQADKSLGRTNQKRRSHAVLVFGDSGQIRKTAALLSVC